MNILKTLAGMGDMTEQIIATDFLLAVKSAVKNYSVAISETTSPEVRQVLRRHLNAAIDTHESMILYMENRGFYHVNNPQEQIRLDIQNAEKALNL